MGRAKHQGFWAPTGILCVAISAGCGSGDNPSPGGAFAAADNALTTAGCTAPFCHGAAKATSTSLSLIGASIDYSTIVTGSGTLGPFYNKTSPSQSNILLIPTNASGMHNGSAAWMSSDAAYMTTLSWLNAGAPQ